MLEWVAGIIAAVVISITVFFMGSPTVDGLLCERENGVLVCKASRF